MKKFNVYLIALLAGLMLFACNQDKSKQSGDDVIISKPDVTPVNGRMSPEVLWAFGRVSELQVSPDQSTVLYGVTYYSIEKNKGNRELFTMKTDGSEVTQITSTPKGEQNAVWKPDGKQIGFLSAESGMSQIYEMNSDGSGKKRVSGFDKDITGFKYNPDGSKVLFTSEVPIKKVNEDLYKDLPLTSGRIYNDHFYRHWDTWVESYSHVFIADLQDGKLSNVKDIMEGETYDSPLKPFGGMEQVTWSPDGKKIAYTSRKKVGLQATLSTNSDIYLYDIESGQVQNLTEGMLGYDVAPVFSPDGKKMAWESMERDGFESDKSRLFVLNLETGEKMYATKDFDQMASKITWSADGKIIYFISPWHGSEDIYKYDPASGKIDRLTIGTHDYTELAVAGNYLIGAKMSMSMPTEIFSVEIATGKEAQLTSTNKELLDKLQMGRVEGRWVETTDKKQMLVWVIYPPDFDPAKKYPALLYCQGGPQSMVSQFWSYRWNFQMMAANDYIVVAPNRRGLPGFGQEWNDQISGDYSGQNMKDYLTAIDAVAKEPFVDKDHLGAVGASYGGYSVFWLAGNHDNRFKALIAHDGIFNLETQYLETDEMWFANWDLGGPYWDKSNSTAQRSFANSPHKFIDKWTAPILVIHGEQDFRIAYTQGMMAFNAAIIRGIPAEFLFFPDENHFVLKPQNGILWQRTFFNWLDKWLKTSK